MHISILIYRCIYIYNIYKYIYIHMFNCFQLHTCGHIRHVRVCMWSGCVRKCVMPSRLLFEICLTAIWQLETCSSTMVAAVYHSVACLLWQDMWHQMRGDRKRNGAFCFWRFKEHRLYYDQILTLGCLGFLGFWYPKFQNCHSADISEGPVARYRIKVSCVFRRWPTHTPVGNQTPCRESMMREFVELLFGEPLRTAKSWSSLLPEIDVPSNYVRACAYYIVSHIDILL